MICASLRSDTFAAMSPNRCEQVSPAAAKNEERPIASAHPDRVEGIGAFNGEREPIFVDPDY